MSAPFRTKDNQARAKEEVLKALETLRELATHLPLYAQRHGHEVTLQTLVELCHLTPVELACNACGESLPGGRRDRIYCSSACRVRAFRARKAGV